MEEFDQAKHDQFLRLYVENEESLRGFVRSLVPTLDDAREVMQETAAVLWKKYDTLDSPSNFRRWAFGVARFEALAFRRDKARDRHVFGEELISLLADDPIHDACDEAQHLQGCLQKLPKKQHKLVEAVYAHGARIDKMATASGKTPMALYKTLHRIRMNLADCIQREIQIERGSL